MWIRTYQVTFGCITILCLIKINDRWERIKVNWKCTFYKDLFIAQSMFIHLEELDFNLDLKDVLTVIRCWIVFGKSRININWSQRLVSIFEGHPIKKLNIIEIALKYS